MLILSFHSPKRNYVVSKCKIVCYPVSNTGKVSNGILDFNRVLIKPRNGDIYGFLSVTCSGMKFALFLK